MFEYIIFHFTKFLYHLFSSTHELHELHELVSGHGGEVKFGQGGQAMLLSYRVPILTALSCDPS